MRSQVKISSFELLKAVLKDPDRKSIFKMSVEIFILLIHFKSFPRHYFSKYLFKKYNTNIKDYFPTTYLYYKFKPFLNEREVCDVVENKLFFDFFYNQFGIRLPKILMYNHRKIFIRDGLSFEVNNLADFTLLLSDVFEQNPSSDSIIVKPTYGSYGGSGIFKIYPDHLQSDPQKIESLYSLVIKTGYLFQETVRQHPSLNRLNPSCLNTIRFETYINPEGQAEIVSAYLRIGMGNQSIDNISAGGCQVGINLQTGKLKKTGYKIFNISGTAVYTVHPDTKVVFEDFAIPLFGEAKEMVLKVAGLVPGLRLVGWDVAIGEQGPVLIEGNSDYDMSGNDLSEDGYRTNETFRKILKELNYK